MNNAEIKAAWNKFSSHNVSYSEFSRRLRAAMEPMSHQEYADIELKKARQRTAKGLIDRAIRRKG